MKRMMAALFLLPLFACGSRTTENALNPVQKALAEQVSSTSRVVAPGLVEPIGGEVDLSAEEPGRVAEILVQEGNPVKKGDLMARLEDSAQLASVAVATAQVAEAQAALLRLRRGATREELTQVASERDAALARATLSADTRSRSDRLKEKGAISPAEWDQAQRQAEADHSTAQAADARYRNLARGSRSEDIQAAQARLDAARAQLTQAEAALARRSVRSPVDATVLWSRFNPGEYFSPGAQALFVLGDVSRLQIRADVDEIDVARVKVGSLAKVRTDAGGTPVAEGKVVWISPRMGRKNITTETPTSRGDLRIREVLVEVPATEPLLSGLRVWTEIPAAQ